MSARDDIRSLASYVTYRELYNEGKPDVYFIISKFEENLILSQGMYRFGLTELAHKMESYYSFKIPTYILQSALKRLKYVIKQGHGYLIKGDMITENSDFEKNYNDAYSSNNKLMDKLLEYANNKKEFAVERIENDELIKDFCRFLLDESYNGKYVQLIVAFNIDHSEDEEITKLIKTIKEGAILYAGLNYSPDISKQNSWDDKIYFYLEQEILFHLAGYNGEVFKQIAEELINLISEMNDRHKIGRIIYLRYFKETKDDIEDFFKNAEEIVSHIATIEEGNIAMKSIVNGCTCPADVLEKKSDFYRMLNAKQIRIDEGTDYYSIANHEFNIETADLEEKYQSGSWRKHYIRHLNYINILRKGEEFSDLKKSGYMLLTETGKILQAASDLNEDNSKVPLAINMYLLTNRLWFDLNKGFGAADLPSSFDVLLRSKIVLSNILNKSVSDKFEAARDKYNSNLISKDELLDRVVALRESQKLPEQINANNLEEINGFISEEEVDIYISEKERLSNAVLEKDNAYKELNEQYKDVCELNQSKDADIQRITEEKETAEGNYENEKNKSLDNMRKRQKNANKKIEKRWKHLKVFVAVAIILIYVLGNWAVHKWLNNYINDLSLIISTAALPLGMIGLLLFEKKTSHEIVFGRIKKFFIDAWTKELYKEYEVDTTLLSPVDEGDEKSA